MVQHQEKRRRIELSIRNRQRLELATLDLHRRQIAHAAAGRLQHLAGSIHSDYPGDKRGERAGNLSRAAAEVPDGPSIVKQSGERLELGVRPKEIRAQLVPLAGGGLEELLRLRLP